MSGVSTNALLVFGIELDEEEIEDSETLEDLVSKTDFLEVVYHCCIEVEMYIIALKEPTYYAGRGYPEKVNKESLNISDNDIKKFKEWIKSNNLPYVISDKEPKWILCSNTDAF